jgi:hypothetical protein
MVKQSDNWRHTSSKSAIDRRITPLKVALIRVMWRDPLPQYWGAEHAQAEFGERVDIIETVYVASA